MFNHSRLGAASWKAGEYHACLIALMIRKIYSNNENKFQSRYWYDCYQQTNLLKLSVKLFKGVFRPRNVKLKSNTIRNEILEARKSKRRVSTIVSKLNDISEDSFLSKLPGTTEVMFSDNVSGSEVQKSIVYHLIFILKLRTQIQAAKVFRTKAKQRR